MTVDVAVSRDKLLNCTSVSYPDSQTTWLHMPESSSEPVPVPGSNSRYSVIDSETLVISKAEMTDAGRFTCNVTNTHGSTLINISLVVVGE